ncbi:hypothetical protein NDU88_002850 [Pleurodeles waltl]|uniref:Uncharacterized protein n=1 Tax=Pleurodeles waltl TaxID=8319 RepID=A0AAV7SE86_PLEWA|nr:hypothetical protein NDU88_002850 [Pleurodeles waltl]
MPSGRLWQRWGPCARSVASVEGLHQGGVPPGPPVPSNCVRGPRVRDLDSRRNCERSRTWSAHLVPAAVGRSPPGRGFQRGEGLPASPRNSKFRLRCERRWSRVARLPPAAADRAASGRGFQQGRGRTPLSATGQTAPAASRPRTALGAQSRLPAVRRREPTLREQAARTSTLGRINPAGPSGAGKLGVRHAPDPGHAPPSNRMLRWWLYLWLSSETSLLKALKKNISE